MFKWKIRGGPSSYGSQPLQQRGRATSSSTGDGPGVTIPLLIITQY